MMNRYGITMCMVIMLCTGLLKAASTPTMSRIYGTPYTQAVPVTQPAGVVGQLVQTGIFGTNGSLSLAGQVPNAQAQAVTVLDDGIMVVTFNDGTNTYVAEYNADGSVNQAFAPTTSYKVTLAGKPNTSNAFLVDKQKRFILAGTGYGGSACWISRITAAGVIDSSFNFTDGARWTTSGCIRHLSMQSSGKIIALGSNGTHAMLARYDLDGALDTSFGSNGYVILDGEQVPFTSTNPLNTVFVDTNDNIYFAYISATPAVFVTRLTSEGVLDTSWNNGESVSIDYISDVSMQLTELNMVVNSNLDLVVAIPSGSPVSIKAASIKTSDGTAGSFANFTATGGVFGTDDYSLSFMMASSDGRVYCVGSDLTLKKSAIIALTNEGVLDRTFNTINAPGVNFFYPSGTQPSGYVNANACALTPTGQIIFAEGQLDGVTTTAYLSLVYSNQYAYQISQHPQVEEEGTRDYLFGFVLNENEPGVVNTYIGEYKNELIQKPAAVIDLILGGVLVGQSGYQNFQDYASMMLVRLTNDGILDTTFGNGGTLILQNASPVSETLTSVYEDGYGNLYVTGYSVNGALIRKYTANGTLLWNADYNQSGFQALSCGTDGDLRLIVLLSGPGNTGQINAYDINTGAFDTHFNQASTHPGIIIATDFALNMGPLYSGATGENGALFIAYKNTVTGRIDAACIANGGSAIFWHQQNIFSAYGSISLDNIRLTFNNAGQIAIAAGYNRSMLLTTLQAGTGFVVQNYPVAFVCGTSLHITQIIGISDDTVLASGYDSSDQTMVFIRVKAAGDLDTNFNSQGIQPGIVKLAITAEIADYYARVPAGIVVQSRIGINQGNIIVSGYEQMFASGTVKPQTFRIFGTPGTTQVKNWPIVVAVAGSFDNTYNGTGIAPTYVLGASSPVANQEVRAIRQLPGIQIITVITDNNTSISYTQKLNADASIDTSYGGGLGIPIANLPGTEVVENMVFDAAGNFLVTGSNNNYGAFVKRILPDGSMDTKFGGSISGVPASSIYPLGTQYYAQLDVITACQQMNNGNIVIVGSAQGQGFVAQISSAGGLVSTFGSKGFVLQGVNATSVSVDSSDNIYVSISYVEGTLLKAGILKLNSDGLAVDTFGVNGFAPTISGLDDSSSVRYAFDNSLRQVVAGSAGMGTMLVQRLKFDGQQDDTFNAGAVLEVRFGIEALVKVTSLVTLNDDRTFISGYLFNQDIPANNYEFIACIAPNGTLEITFGTGVVPGIVTFQIASTDRLARRIINMNLQANGKILLAGGEVPALDEEIPLTFRMNSFDNTQPVPQFSGYKPMLQSVLNTYFNRTGISASSVIPGLSSMGTVTVDTDERPLITGRTSLGEWVVARFARTGALDESFGDAGVVQTSFGVQLIDGGPVVTDIFNRVYLGGITDNGYFVVTRLTADGLIDTSFGTDGLAYSSRSLPTLVQGGCITLDNRSRIIVGGRDSDGNLVVTKFLPSGLVDASFAQATNNIAFVPVSLLISGGSVVTDNYDNIFIGGYTSTTMVVGMLNNVGDVVAEYGTDGIASTTAISGLSSGGVVSIDQQYNIVILGLNSNQQFIVARFTLDGTLDPLFAGTGIAYSPAVDILDQIGTVVVDNNNNIVVGGLAKIFNNKRAFIVARFTSEGILDTSFTVTGMASSGPIADVSAGGYIGIDTFNNIFVGGLTDNQETHEHTFVLAEMFSGAEIFISDSANLRPQDLRTYYYGTDPDYFKLVFDVDAITKSKISNVTIREIVRLELTLQVQNYINCSIHQEPGYENLVWLLYQYKSRFNKACLILSLLYEEYADQITSSFDFAIVRMNEMALGKSSL